MNPFHLLMLLAVVLIWGYNFVIIKTSLQQIPPIFLCFSRFFLCLPALLFIRPPPVPFQKIALYSLVMFVFQFSLLFISMYSGITAGLASLLLQFQVFFAIAFAILFLKEKYALWQGAGASIAFLGILLIAAHTGEDITWKGLFLILAAAVMWAMGSMLAKKMEKGSGLSLVVWGSLVACPPLLVLSLCLEGPEAIWNSLKRCTLTHFCAVSYIAYLSTLGGFGIWNWLLRYYPLSQLSPFTLLVPLIGMTSSSLVLKEVISWWKLSAAALILAGLGFHFFSSHFFFFDKKDKK